MKKYVFEVVVSDDDVCMEVEADILNEFQYLAYELLCSRIYKPESVSLDGVPFVVSNLKKVWGDPVG